MTARFSTPDSVAVHYTLWQVVDVNFGGAPRLMSGFEKTERTLVRRAQRLAVMAVRECQPFSGSS